MPIMQRIKAASGKKIYFLAAGFIILFIIFSVLNFIVPAKFATTYNAASDKKIRTVSSENSLFMCVLPTE